MLTLADALKAHQRARECGEIIEREGYSETGRDGQSKPHHLLASERSAMASYQRQLKQLGRTTVRTTIQLLLWVTVATILSRPT